MDSNSDERSRALTKNEQLAFEKLKLKWKELPVEVSDLNGVFACVSLKSGASRSCRTSSSTAST